MRSTSRRSSRALPCNLEKALSSCGADDSSIRPESRSSMPSPGNATNSVESDPRLLIGDLSEGAALSMEAAHVLRQRSATPAEESRHLALVAVAKDEELSKDGAENAIHQER